MIHLLMLLLCASPSATAATPRFVVDPDEDNDGHPASVDCNDEQYTVHPGAPEVVGDALDQDCDGVDDCYRDDDGDGWGTLTVVTGTSLLCDEGPGTSSDSGDCDDRSPAGESVHPGATEACDGLDNNCDGQVDEVSSADAITYYLDADGDGFGLLTSTVKACGLPLGYSEMAGDCDDTSSRTYPGNTELCDGVDNNCVDGVDEASAFDAAAWQRDADGDGFYDADTPLVDGCHAPEPDLWLRYDALTSGEDCDDDDPKITDQCYGGCACTQTPTTAPFALLPLLLWPRRRR
jgi:uncharacterized protein (TIGR03382 family)